VRFKCQKWYRYTPVVFYMLDVSRANSWTVRHLQELRHPAAAPPKHLTKTEFGWELVRCLVTPYMQARQIRNKISRPKLVHAMANFLGTEDGRPAVNVAAERWARGEEDVPKLTATKRCKICLSFAPPGRTRNNLTKVGTCCYNCQRILCLRHLVTFCHQCCAEVFRPA